MIAAASTALADRHAGYRISSSGCDHAKGQRVAERLSEPRVTRARLAPPACPVPGRGWGLVILTVIQEVVRGT
jgi:hypothetical protein